MDDMNITSAQYIQNCILDENDNLVLDGTNHSIKIALDGVELHVPLDPANRHYAEIMRQVNEGTLVIQPAEEQS